MLNISFRSIIAPRNARLKITKFRNFVSLLSHPYEAQVFKDTIYIEIDFM